jgi:hypothetical protein
MIKTVKVGVFILKTVNFWQIFEDSNQEFDFPIACRKSRHSCFKQSVYHYMGHLKKNVHISVRMVLSGVSGRCITLTFEFWIEM